MMHPLIGFYWFLFVVVLIQVRLVPLHQYMQQITLFFGNVNVNNINNNNKNSNNNYEQNTIDNGTGGGFSTRIQMMAHNHDSFNNDNNHEQQQQQQQKNNSIMNRMDDFRTIDGGTGTSFATTATTNTTTEVFVVQGLEKNKNKKFHGRSNSSSSSSKPPFLYHQNKTGSSSRSSSSRNRILVEENGTDTTTTTATDGSSTGSNGNENDSDNDGNAGTILDNDSPYTVLLPIEYQYKFFQIPEEEDYGRQIMIGHYVVCWDNTAVSTELPTTDDNSNNNNNNSSSSILNIKDVINEMLWNEYNYYYSYYAAGETSTTTTASQTNPTVNGFEKTTTIPWIMIDLYETIQCFTIQLLDQYGIGITVDERYASILRNLIPSPKIVLIEQDQIVELDELIFSSSEEEIIDNINNNIHIVNASDNMNTNDLDTNNNIVPLNQFYPPWGIDRIDQTDLPLNQLYHADYTGKNVSVYVLDTGIDVQHEHFLQYNPNASNEQQEEEKIVTTSRASCLISAYPEIDCFDKHGHGTHVAGIIGSRIYGIAQNVQLEGVKVLNNKGLGRTSTLLHGIDYIIQQRLAEPNRSMVAISAIPYYQSPTLEHAIVQLTYVHKVFLGLPAGNQNRNICGGDGGSNSNTVDFYNNNNNNNVKDEDEQTASYYVPSTTVATHAVIVASTNQNDERSSFSNYGSCISLFAPGTNIQSIWIHENGNNNSSSSDNNNNKEQITTATKVLSGTTMATAHVVGVAALYLSTYDKSNTEMVVETKNLGGVTVVSPLSLITRMIDDGVYGTIRDTYDSTNVLLNTEQLFVTTPKSPPPPPILSDNESSSAAGINRFGNFYPYSSTGVVIIKIVYFYSYFYWFIIM